MEDKEKQIEEIQKLLIKYFRLYGYKLPDEVVELVACDFYENNICKIPEGSVVISKDEYEKTTRGILENIFVELFHIASIHHSDVANILVWAKDKAKQLGIEIKG